MRPWPFKVATMRLHHIYGPRDAPSKFLPWFIGKVLRNEGPINLTLGNQQRDFVYVEDVAAAYYILLCGYKQLGAVSDIDVGTGDSVALRYILSLVVRMAEESGRPIPRLHFGALPYRDGEVMESRADRTLMDSLGWRPAHSLESGLEKTLEYFSKFHERQGGRSEEAGR